MDDHRIDKHWRKPPDDNIGDWVRELRSRSHDIADWASRVEGMILRVEQKVATPEQVAAMVEKKLRHGVVSGLSKFPKIVAAAIVVMQALILWRK